MEFTNDTQADGRVGVAAVLTLCERHPSSGRSAFAVHDRRPCQLLVLTVSLA